MELSVDHHPDFFTKTELKRALSEQSFGIINFEMGEATKHEAVAWVTLLEGNNVTIAIAADGFHLKDSESAPFYETVEDLLLVVSPLYMKARHEKLLEKLYALENLRSKDPEGELIENTS